MIVDIKVDMDMSIENGKIVIRAFHPNDDSITFVEEMPLFDLVAQFTEYFKVMGTDNYKLDAADVIEFETLQAELDDSLQLVSEILEQAD